MDVFLELSCFFDDPTDVGNLIRKGRGTRERMIQAEKPEIKLPTSAGSSKKQESSRKTSTSPLLITPKSLNVWITINWKILREMGISDHLTCLLRNLYADQEVTELDMEQQTGSK